MSAVADPTPRGGLDTVEEEEEEEEEVIVILTVTSHYLPVHSCC